MKKCPTCQKEFNDEAKFCGVCGTAFVEEKVSPSKPKKKKFFKIGIPVIAVVLVAAIVLSIFSFLKKSDYIIYAKEDMVYLYDFSGEPIELCKTNDLTISPVLPTVIREKVFYISDCKEDKNLYYINLNSIGKKPIKIASDVYYFWVSTDGKTVTYKDGKDALYQRNLRKSTKIDTGISSVKISPDGKKLLFIDFDDNLCFYNNDKKTQKLAKDVKTFSATEDLSVIYFINNAGNLYKNTDKNKNKKIDSNVENIAEIYKTGEIYYEKDKHEKGSKDIYDYFIDDKIEEDANSVEPQKPEEPERPNFTDYASSIEGVDKYKEELEKYEKAYDAYSKLYEEYLELREEYWASSAYIRTELDNWENENTVSTLCYYNGKNKTVLTDSCSDYYSYDGDLPIISYCEYTETEEEKVKISQVSSMFQLESIIRDTFFAKVHRLAIKDKEHSFDREVDIVSSSDGGKTIFYTKLPVDEDGGRQIKVYNEEFIAEDIEKTVYKAEVSADGIKETNKYDDVGYYYCIGQGDIIYQKESGLYLNDKVLSENAFSKGDDIDYIDFFVQYNYNKGKLETLIYPSIFDYEGITLYLYDGNKTEWVMDDIPYGRYSTVSLTKTGKVAFIYDINEKEKGDLYIWEKGEKTLIDSDVLFIVDGESLH